MNPVLMFAAETWRITKKLEKKSWSMQRAMERKIMEVISRDRKKSEWVREQTGLADILIDIR